MPAILALFAQFHLGNDSILDVYRHPVLYTAVLELLCSITKWPTLVPLLKPLRFQACGQSLYRLLFELDAKVRRTAALQEQADQKGSAAASSSPAPTAEQLAAAAIKEKLSKVIMSTMDQLNSVITEAEVAAMEAAQAKAAQGKPK